MTGHDHLLDGTLHDGCPMCDEIKSRREGAAREAGADTLSRHFAAVARREQAKRRRC